MTSTPGSSQAFASAAGFNPHMAKAIVDVGSSMFDKQIGDAQVKISQSVGGVKQYFRVNHSYVANKLKLLVWPFFQKRWDRTPLDEVNGEAVSYRTPREDLFAPDLYIPTMAFCTYVLIICVALGVSNRFTPESLGVAASTCLAVLLVEVGGLKLVCYLMDIAMNLLDIISYCSYTLVGVDAAIVVGMVAGRYGYYGTLLYTAIASAYFLLKTLRPTIMRASPRNAAGSVNGAQEQKRQRQYVLLAIAAAQIPISLFLGMAPSGGSAMNIPPTATKFVPLDPKSD
eukprot:c34000_g1_i1.p1 GENE.c34000_g1_i1~~c34000_g1_i1.p1  ORF type:complete len:328 (-),score=55.06 c34000_g1_i1:48-902(-)